MGFIRYLAYFFGIAAGTWGLVWLELAFPGSLQLGVPSRQDGLPTSEYSPVEAIQLLLLLAAGVLLGWIARNFPSQRPISLPFVGFAFAFLVRELDFFLDQILVDDLWKLLVGIVAAVGIVYIFRERRRLRIALARIWPSPGLTLIFAGSVILFAVARFIGYEPLWQSILGAGYRPVVELAAEEFLELLGYSFWMIGTIEYAYQVRAIESREPQAAVQRRRAQRRKRKKSSF